MTTSSKPLAGLKVLDFGHTIMGPCAGVVFADLGADVVKIEPVDGDPTRRLPGFAAGFFATYNRNKRSIAIDLKRPEGQAIVHRLVRDADVVLENFGPGTIERLKCSWEDLRQINPRLVYLSMKGFLKGPYENRGALDEVVQMQSGLAYMTGPPGRPLRAGAPVIDILGGVFGVVAALSALRERDATGIGQKVASSLFESATFMLGALVVGSAVIGGPLPPMPARKNAWGVYDVFTASDGGQVFIGCTSDGHWQRFCETSASTTGATIRGLQATPIVARRASGCCPSSSGGSRNCRSMKSLKSARRRGWPIRGSDGPMNCLMIRICLPMAACLRRPYPDWAADRWSESPRFRWSSATGANAQVSTASRRRSASTRARF